jgi:hypothetical protein
VIGDDEAAEGVVRLQALRGAKRTDGEALVLQEVVRRVLRTGEGCAAAASLTELATGGGGSAAGGVG